MDIREGLGRSVLIGVLLLGPALAHAGDVTQGDFSVGWELHLIGGRDTAVKGYVDNRSPLRVGDVHLRVETLDETGKVVGESFGWVMGDVPAGGRGYFVVRVPVAGSAYRVTVDSYDAISTSAWGGEDPMGPPAASPALSP